MLSTKTRSTVIALVASVSVAGAAAPMVAQADTKSSGPSKQETCDNLYGEFERWVDIADGLYKQEGNGGTFKAALDTAESTLHAAENAGCDWASRVRPSTKVVSTPTLAGTLQASPEVGTSPSRVTKLSGAQLAVR